MRNQNLAEKYPNLFISQDCRAVWVLRDGRDAEAMHYGNVFELDLSALNEEATKAIQPGWFYCTGCKKAKPRTEYAYFHFAGKYCKDCETANPQKALDAARETYE